MIVENQFEMFEGKPVRNICRAPKLPTNELWIGSPRGILEAFQKKSASIIGEFCWASIFGETPREALGGIP